MKKILIIIGFVLIVFGKTSAQDTLYATGCLFDENLYNSQPKSALLVKTDYSNLPKSYSLKRYSPTPKTQGQQGSCTAWATGYAARTIAWAIKNKKTDKSTIINNAFSPSYIYNQIKTHNNCFEGSFIHKALNLLITQGCPKLIDYPYNASSCSRLPTSSDKKKASYFKISGYKTLVSYSSYTTNNTLIKKSISENKPVVIAFKTYRSFHNMRGVDVWNGDKTGIYGHHAMTVVAYDDYKYGGAFLLQNSWGDWWGNGGYLWIKYADFNTSCEAAYELIEDYRYVPPKPVKKYDLAGNIKFEFSTGENIDAIYNYSTQSYKSTTNLVSGTQYRMYITNNEPAYVYAIGSDLTGEIVKIFPPDNSISAALTYKSNKVAIPNEEWYIQASNFEGIDYICLLYSKIPIDIDNSISKMKRQNGTFKQKIDREFKSNFVQKNNIKYSQNNISFSASSSGKYIVPLIFEMKIKD